MATEQLSSKSNAPKGSINSKLDTNGSLKSSEAGKHNNQKRLIVGGGGRKGMKMFKMGDKLSPGCCRRKRRKTGNESWDNMGYSESQNSVSTLDLFRYASNGEKFAVCVGIVLMWYAASWQPISVFILAIMATLMGQYSKQVNWILHLHNESSNEQLPTSVTRGPLAAAVNLFSNFTSNLSLLSRHHPTPVGILTKLNLEESHHSANFEHQNQDYNLHEHPTHYDHHHPHPHHHHLGELLDHQHQQLNQPTSLENTDYENFPLLRPFYSLVTPLFEITGSSNETFEDENIKMAVHDILQHESNQFLRKSFEINGSAFLLALTQLLAFFMGMLLITWAAKKQASRLKILYFSSALYQEVTWFEAIDSAGGAGSSLNALVERYEDGIGMKLALLCYFLGHIALFALTAFYQLFNLAAFCMPFVFLVGFVIAYLSQWQADSIGDHALFAKRSLQLAEEIMAAIRTVFAFNGQQKEITRFSISLQPVYRKSLMKHLYTALNTSLSKFSIFACFSIYCFYAMRLFPPYDEHGPSNRATVLAVMRGAEVSIVNILISIPFMEALQQSKGSIARIYAAIERRSKIDPSSKKGVKPTKWAPSISFRMVSFGYAERSGPTRRRSTVLPFLNLPGSPSSQQQSCANVVDSTGATGTTGVLAGNDKSISSSVRRKSLIENLADELDCPAANLPPTPHPTPTGQSNTRKSSRTNSIATDNILGITSAEDLIKGAKTLSVQMRREIEARHETKKILNKFNLEIKAGQSVAFVGPSGSGKSTVLALVQRLYDITTGQLLVGQHNVKDLNVGWLRNQIGVVSQEARLFDMSIGDNIKLGLKEEKFPSFSSKQSSGSSPTLSIENVTSENFVENEKQIMQQVVEAAKAANAHDFITKLPHGYNTKVGSGGVQLSGGQKQRIAIARALIRKPKILLLDECTSALDTESELTVKEALKEASKGRTTLTVAHRLDTIKHADLIVVMNEGQLVECGTHEELMRRRPSQPNGSGLYKLMYEEQRQTVDAIRLASAERRLAKKKKKTKDVLLSQLEVEAANNNRRLSKVDFGIFGEGKEVIPIKEPSSSSSSDDEDDQDAINYEYEYGEYYDDERFNVNYEQLSDSDDDDESSLFTTTNVERPSAWQLWQFVDMPKWSALAATLVCLLSGLILPMNLIAHSYLFSAFAYSDMNELGDYLHVFGLIILSFSTLVFIVSFLQIILPGYVGEKLSVRLRVRLMHSLLNKPMFYFDMDSNSAGAICDRFNSYIAHLQNIAGSRTATMLEAVSTLTAGAFFGFGQNLTLSLFCLSFALLVLLTTIVESRIMQREASLNQKYDAKLAHMIADALSNIKTIASLNKESYFIAKFTDIIKQRELGAGKAMPMLRTFLTSLKFVMPAMSWSASMYYGCHLLVDGRIDLQTIFIVCPVVLFAVNDTFRALVFLPELLKARKSIKRLYRMHHEFSPQVLQTLTLAQQFEQQNKLHIANMEATRGSAEASLQQQQQQPQQGKIVARKSIVVFKEPMASLSEEPDGVGKEEPKEQPINRRMSNINNLPSYMGRKGSRLNSLVPRSMARGRIDFRNVEFAYPNRPTALVLDGFTLSIEPGESVALVGGSGSGKSTCVSILEKFYDYHGGHVSLDGHDLRLVESNWVRSQIGLVSQEASLLSYTIGDNIRYGDNSRFVSMDEVVEAARTANIHDFIMSLPDQYETELSSSSYSSSQLSGGQRQRIAIARALIGNAPILIFDEATSALDTRNETVVQDALNKARRGRTNLTIAHRLATVRDSDKIAVMKEGKVVEMGSHDELLKIENGHYKSLWERQEGSSSSSSSSSPPLNQTKTSIIQDESCSMTNDAK